MIDEVHTLIGAGAAEGAIDAANILKPALARGELQCIGATTLDEYRKHIEKDPCLGEVHLLNSLTPACDPAHTAVLIMSSKRLAAQMIDPVFSLLYRRFQPVKVPEPSVDETYQILLGLRERYEAHHKVALHGRGLALRRQVLLAIYL